ncbi:MAG: response regulator [Syntrophotaleaceae bacterium]
MRVVPFLTTPNEVQDAIRKHYIKASESKSAEELTVMVVDDQDLWRAAFQGNLKKEGLRSVQFGSGPAALKAVLKERPHLILVDAGMTGMTGVELFRVLQSNKCHPGHSGHSPFDQGLAGRRSSPAGDGFFRFCGQAGQSDSTHGPGQEGAEDQLWSRPVADNLSD